MGRESESSCRIQFKEYGDGGFHAHENHNVLDRSKLACTMNDLAKLTDILNKTVIIEFCSRERINTKRRFEELKKLTVFADLLKDVPLGCRDAVLYEPLLKILIIKYLPYDENTGRPYRDNLCVSRAPALHLHRNQRLEEKKKRKDLLTLEKLLSDLNNLDGNITRNFLDEVCRKTKLPSYC